MVIRAYYGAIMFISVNRSCNLWSPFAMFGFYLVHHPQLVHRPSFATSLFSHTLPYIDWDSIALWRIQRLRANDIKKTVQQDRPSVMFRNAKELTAWRTKEMCYERGTQSLPQFRTHPNRVVECLFGGARNGTRAMLWDKGLPPRSWGEVITIFMYL